jgi:hypothetical protein
MAYSSKSQQTSLAILINKPEVNFRKKFFFNLALKVKLRVTLTKFFKEDSLFNSRLHMDAEVLHHLIPRLCFKFVEGFDGF